MASPLPSVLSRIFENEFSRLNDDSNRSNLVGYIDRCAFDHILNLGSNCFHMPQLEAISSCRHGSWYGSPRYALFPCLGYRSEPNGMTSES